MENDDFKKNRVKFVCKKDDLKRKLDEKIKFHEKIKEEQFFLRKKMDELSNFL